ncbi:nop53 (60S ribosomal biogenesis) domain-containing protein [Sarocladium implicatum]|nr:nop53 (60S ribosomal biogenesis) domain-containing protein [Sarocladium implicatum]
MAILKGPIGESTEAPNQYTQPSRKGKKAWRKNVDVTEVQKGLQDLNEEIIRGGVIKEKDSADLFTLDVKGDSAISKRHPKHASKKGLKADEIIAARSAVPAVSMRKRPGDGKITDGLVPAKRVKKDWVSQKELSRLKRVADGQHDNTIDIRDATYDVWGAAPEPTPVEAAVASTRSVAKAPKSYKQKPLSLLANGKEAVAVPKPTGGYSYNPDFQEYEARLNAESEKAIEAERKRLAAEEAERQRQEAAARSAAEAEAAEARAELSEWEDDSEWEGFASGVEDDDKPDSKMPGRKTQAQRNRIKRRKQEEQLAKHRAAMKAKRIQEQRIKEIAEEVAQRDANKQLAKHSGAEEDSAEDDMEADDSSKLRRRQVGKYKLPDRDLELVLPDELQESLRLLKPEGNLLKDRYRSMLVRGRVESRRHIPYKKQAKKHITEKWTHKDFVL